MKEELRREISAELRLGSKISAASVRRLMRKHSVSMTQLWDAVKKVQNTKNAFEIANAPEAIELQKKIVEKYSAPHTEVYDAPKIDATSVIDEFIPELQPANIPRRPINPFALLRTRRAWKLETGSPASEWELLQIQQRLMDGKEQQLSGELQQLILSL